MIPFQVWKFSETLAVCVSCDTGDSLEGDLRSRNNFGKCGDKWITGDSEIDFPPAGDTERLAAT
jgi:hypothetical protein